MSYSRKVYARAASELERRRDKAERTQSMRRAEVYAKIPELIYIDREIASAGAEVIRAIGMGENAQQFIEELAKKISPLSSAAKIYSKKTAIPRTILTRSTPAKVPRYGLYRRSYVRLLQGASARHRTRRAQRAFAERTLDLREL